MKLIRVGFLTAAATIALVAQVSAQQNKPIPAQPMHEQQTPEIRQTPDGKAMKTAGDTKPLQESQAGPSTGSGTSTGPTFPNSPSGK